jgi:hypothetical protein
MSPRLACRGEGSGSARGLPLTHQANPLIEIDGHFLVLGLRHARLIAAGEFIGNRLAIGLRSRRGRMLLTLLSNDGGKSHGGSFLVSKCRNRWGFVL